MEKYREKITRALKRSLEGVHRINDEAGTKTSLTLSIEDGQPDKKLTSEEVGWNRNCTVFKHSIKKWLFYAIVYQLLKLTTKYEKKVEL